MWGLFVAAVLAGEPPSLLDKYRAPPVGVEQGDPFAWSAAPVTATVGKPAVVTLRVAVPAGHRLYRDQLEVRVAAAPGVKVGAPVLPASRLVDDGDGSVRAGYDADVVITVPVTVAKAGAVTLRFDVHHQGCRTGLCYPGVDRAIDVVVTAR